MTAAARRVHVEPDTIWRHVVSVTVSVYVAMQVQRLVLGGASAHMEVRDAESDAKCDLNTCGGYDSGTCDGGSSTTASEMSESVAAQRGGHRRGKRRGPVSRSVRRARAEAERDGMRVAASDDDT